MQNCNPRPMQRDANSTPMVKSSEVIVSKVMVKSRGRVSTAISYCQWQIMTHHDRPWQIMAWINLFFINWTLGGQPWSRSRCRGFSWHFSHQNFGIHYAHVLYLGTAHGAWRMRHGSFSPATCPYPKRVGLTPASQSVVVVKSYYQIKAIHDYFFVVNPC